MNKMALSVMEKESNSAIIQGVPPWFLENDIALWQPIQEPPISAFPWAEVTDLAQPTIPISKIVAYKPSKTKIVYFMEPKSCRINFTDMDSDETLTINVEVQIKYWVCNNLTNTNKIFDSYYIISYNSNMNEKNRACHPFYGDKTYDKASYSGEIIKKNNMTTKMIDYLLMDERKLSKFTGNTTAVDYKGNIMKQIALLWD